MEGDLVRVSSYIRENLARGYSKEQIRQALINVGWNIETVGKAFAYLDESGELVTSAGPQTAVSSSNVAFKMKAVPILVALILLVIFNVYAFFLQNEFSIFTLSVGFAAAAAFCIGFSFALSGMSYYFNFLDREIAYRKNLGLVGYFLALIYSFLLLIVNPERYFFGFFENILSADFILGLLAMGILSLMAIVSNNFVMRKIGAHAWRFILRLGYFAYFLLILRAVILEGEDWFSWLQRFDSLPPPRLLVSIFAAFVIALRISMEFSMRSKRRND